MEAIPVAGDVAELLAESGLGRDAGALLLQPVAEGLDQGCVPFLPLARRRSGGLPRKSASIV